VCGRWLHASWCKISDAVNRNPARACMHCMLIPYLCRARDQTRARSAVRRTTLCELARASSSGLSQDHAQPSSLWRHPRLLKAGAQRIVPTAPSGCGALTLPIHGWKVCLSELGCRCVLAQDRGLSRPRQLADRAGRSSA
jgi:hypothetical protein